MIGDWMPLFIGQTESYFHFGLGKETSSGKIRGIVVRFASPIPGGILGIGFQSDHVEIEIGHGFFRRKATRNSRKRQIVVMPTHNGKKVKINHQTKLIRPIPKVKMRANEISSTIIDKSPTNWG
jgi:hypothetical protein